MKNLRQSCAAVVLTLALTLTAFADGNISTGVAEPPPPSAAGQISTGSADGHIGTGSADGQIGTGIADPVTAFALGLVQSMLSLF